jgi:ABC-type Na+ transport system ATPase subunit NatA
LLCSFLRFVVAGAYDLSSAFFHLSARCVVRCITLQGINGAGKTTTLKMLSGDLLPTSGTASIAGFDVITEQLQLRRLLGCVLYGPRSVHSPRSARTNTPLIRSALSSTLDHRTM